MAKEIRSQFDALLSLAERAAMAARFDELGQIGNQLEAFVGDLANNADADVDRALLEHMRAGLVRYQGLCAFFAGTLQAAFKSAAEDRDGGYARDGENPGANAQAVLTRRYG